MINGLPGNVTKAIASFADKEDNFNLMPFSLTGQEIQEESVLINDLEVKLIKPDVRETIIKEIKSEYPSFITIDYTHPTAVNSNAVFYVENNLPFVMGTTGGDRDKLEKTVKESSTPAVIAPNMAKQIVGFQAIMAYGAATFPGLFNGYKMRVVESHQKGKADTSGTARAMIGYFNDMGIEFDVEQIEMERDPAIQEKEWKIPKEHIGGHGWHTYTLTAPDGSAMFEFKHNINGRDIYAPGTLEAVRFLKDKIDQPDRSKQLYTMIDVLSQKTR